MRLMAKEVTDITIHEFLIDQTGFDPKITSGAILVDIVFKDGKFDKVAMPNCLRLNELSRDHWRVYGDIAQMIEQLEDEYKRKEDVTS